MCIHHRKNVSIYGWKPYFIKVSSYFFIPSSVDTNHNELSGAVAIDKYSGEVVAVGTEAKEMLGRTPENLNAIRPLKDGVISTYTDVTSEYYLVDTPAKEMKEGYPLSSILINKKVNKYDVYLTETEKKIGQADDNGFINFIQNNSLVYQE